MNRDILTVIQENMSTFSKGQKRIANYILESYDKAAFMTASRLGKTVSVSESTVVRFAAELGYDGYPSMQRSLQKMIRNRLTSVQRIEVANDRIGDQDVLDMVLQSDIDKIRQTLDEIDRDSFENATDAIVAVPDHFLQGLLHTGVSVIAQLRREAHHSGLADADPLAQLAGRHKGRLVIGLQNVVGDPLLPLGEAVHIFLDHSQNITIHSVSSSRRPPDAQNARAHGFAGVRTAPPLREISFLVLHDNGSGGKMQVNSAGFHFSLANFSLLRWDLSPPPPAEGAAPPRSEAATGPASAPGPARPAPPAPA